MTQQYVKDFLNKHINLDEARYKKIIVTFQETKEWLERSGQFGTICIQGSVATKTSIKPKDINQEYDLDVAVQIYNNDFIGKKNILDELLRSKYNNVSRRKKCINVKWNKEFNADYVIMRNLNNKQAIFDEYKKEIIESNNLNLMETFNNVFSNSANDSLRDCAKLIKFYLRQNQHTDELLPSIAQNILICSYNANSYPGYIDQMNVVLSRIINLIKEYIQSNKLLYITNPSNNNYINLNIKNINDMRNIVHVLETLQRDIATSQLRIST
ncbi:MAG: cyclic GMP-AMP synthase DncV-like nucleotidyltransferase [Metamycoplasmataceae bacterium]